MCSSLRIISILNALTHASSNFLTSGVTKKITPLHIIPRNYCDYHIIPRNYSSRKRICGNVHENWNLIRLLPFLIGDLIPEDELAWQVILDLKEIVQLAVAPAHTDETIAYLDIRVSEHRQRLLQLNPVVKLLPKHHYLEHYTHLIRCLLVYGHFDLKLNIAFLNKSPDTQIFSGISHTHWQPNISNSSVINYIRTVSIHHIWKLQKFPQYRLMF